ncbi:MAG: HD domain-containing protein [bacterium]|nr:HD domain-containing protein [bacterium]
MNIAQLKTLFETRGDSEYGGEAVTQLEHALQAAALAEEENASPQMIVAALLHDVGHLMHELPADAPENGVDDHHENTGSNQLKKVFPLQVTEPIRMHVDAKRYLCAKYPEYFRTLSEPSIVSLRLQGGPMNPQETADFEANEFAHDATRLRRWDDTAKVPNLETKSLDHYWEYVKFVASAKSEAS